MIDDDGVVQEVPAGWEHLPPGDAFLTRRVKAGPHWAVEEQRGSKRFSRGVWAPAADIARAQAAVTLERASPAHTRQLAVGRARRDREQADYVVAFTRHVRAFLAFHERYAAMADALAERVAVHATPVGSGTVARTERIPVAERAEAAVIAWMRHQTTAYDRMSIARIKGQRREVRRLLAQRSRALLEGYRSGAEMAPDCPLARALARPDGREPRLSEPAPTRPPARAQAVADDPPRAAPDDSNDEASRRLTRMQAVRDRLRRAVRPPRSSP